jgi:hypothetical protein
MTRHYEVTKNKLVLFLYKKRKKRVMRRKEGTYWRDDFLWWGNRLREGKERKSKVDKTVLVFVEFLILHKFEEFETHKTCDQGCSGNHCWNNLSGNTLGLKGRK